VKPFTEDPIQDPDWLEEKGYEPLPPIHYWIKLALEARPDNWDESVLHASDMGYGPNGSLCPRQLKLRLNGAGKKDLGTGTRLFFHFGHVFEQEINKLIEEGMATDNAGWEFVSSGASAKLFPDISGESDRMFYHRLTDNYVVDDQKTVRSKKFHYMADDSHDNYKAQIRAYLEATDSDYGCITYVDRGGENLIMQEKVERDGDKLDQDVRAIRKIRDSEELPPVISPKVAKTKPRGKKEDEYTVTYENPDEKLVKNQGREFVTDPWQCDYCDFKGVSCIGAYQNWLKDQE